MTALRSLARLSPSRAGALLFALSMLLVGCRGGSGDAARRPLKVEVARVEEADFAFKLDGIATLEAERVVQLAAQVSGRVLRLPVRQGQRVSRGQVVLVLDQTQLQAELASLRSQALTDRLNFQRYETLVQLGAATAFQRDQYRQMAMASRQTLAAREADLSYRNVRAPQDGVIGEIRIKQGDVLPMGVPFTQLVSNHSLRAKIELPASRAAQIRVGLPVELHNPGQPQRPLRTRITAVDPSIVPGTQLLLAEAPIPPGPGLWRNGLRLRADVIVQTSRELAVPFGAVTRLAGQSFVFVVGDRAQLKQRPGRVSLASLAALPSGTRFALQVPVQLGPLQHNRYPVLKGLSPGDRVITSGLLQLRHGMPVQLP